MLLWPAIERSDKDNLPLDQESGLIRATLGLCVLNNNNSNREFIERFQKLIATLQRD